MTTTPRRIIDKASVQVRVGSTSGDSGYDSGPDQSVLIIQASKRGDFWLNDTRDKPVALHDESETSEDIKASRIAIAKGEILRFNNAIRPFHETELKDLQWKLKLPSFSPKLLQTETAQKLKGGASNDTEKIPSEPTTEKNTQRTNAPSTPLPLSTIFSPRDEQPAYVKAFIHLIQKLPDEKKHLLQHGCHCKNTHNQVSHDNVHEEGYDVLYTEDEDEKDAIEDATYVADEKDIGAVEGESSTHAVPRNRSAVTKRSPKTGRAAGKKPSPPKHGRKIGKSGDDGDEDDGKDDSIRGHNIPRSSNTWLCPFFILWFIEIFCPNIVLHTPPPPLRQCCRPPTAIKNFSGLRYHLRRDHGAEIDETILNNIMNAKFTGVDFQRYQQIWAALFPDVTFPEFFSSHLYDIQLCSHVQDILIQTFLALMDSGTEEMPADTLQRNSQASAWIVRMSLEMGAIFGSDLINGARERSRTNDLPQSSSQASDPSQGHAGSNVTMAGPTGSPISVLGGDTGLSSPDESFSAVTPLEQVQITPYSPSNFVDPGAAQPLSEGFGVLPSINRQLSVSRQPHRRQQSSSTHESTANVTLPTSLQPAALPVTTTSPSLQSLEQTRQELLEEIERRHLLQEIADLRQQLATLPAQPNNSNPQSGWM